LNAAVSSFSASTSSSVSSLTRRSSLTRLISSSKRSPFTPRTTLPNICTKRRYESHAKRSFSVLFASPWTDSSFNPRFRTVSSIPGIDSRAPDRTDTSNGSSGSPSRLPARSSSSASAASTCSSSPSGNPPARMYSTHASVVIVNPAGTRSAPRIRVISATLAPLPPSSSRISREPSENSYTHLLATAARSYLATAWRKRTPA
jgi:hypothetical protein